MPKLTTEQIKLLMHQRLLTFTTDNLTDPYEVYPISVSLNERGQEYFICFYRPVTRDDRDFRTYAFNPTAWDFYLPAKVENDGGYRWREVESSPPARSRDTVPVSNVQFNWNGATYNIAQNIMNGSTQQLRFYSDRS